jgi:hypothetical protein
MYHPMVIWFVVSNGLERVRLGESGSLPPITPITIFTCGGNHNSSVRHSATVVGTLRVRRTGAA